MSRLSSKKFRESGITLLTRMTLSLFDATAREFAGSTDQSIREGRYARGQLFSSALRDQVPRCGHVLDFGCGPGRIARLVAAQGFTVHGVDGSEGMLAEARKHCFDCLGRTAIS